MIAVGLAFVVGCIVAAPVTVQFGLSSLILPGLVLLGLMWRKAHLLGLHPPKVEVPGSNRGGCATSV